ncbi:phosphatase PAP2 family protein [Candidatus Shapirobacteria bacterium]|nr:phosphatase PAP2 family protein [Candidatus Shapirobacteria bacterium]
MRDFKLWLKQEKNGLKNDFYSYPKRNFLFLILGVAVLLLALFRLWTVISVESVFYGDNLIVKQIEILRTSFGDNFFLLVTNLGSAYFILGAFLILAIFLVKKKRKKAAVAVFLTLAGSAFLIYLFKNLFSRPRPFGCLNLNDCFSFPSGHTTIAVYFYGLLFHLTTRFLKLKKRTVYVLGLLIGLIIILVALSRIYLGFHFLTDVVGGFLLGSVLLLVAAILIDFLYQ